MTTVSAWLIAAIIAQAAIAMVLLIVLGLIRVPMVTSGRMPLRDVALSREPWPVHEKRVSNAFDNQFQLPVLFYVACGLALYFQPSWLEVALAWGFVLSRVVHAAVFATTNNVPQRFLAYTVGTIVLGLLGLDVAVRLIVLAMGGH